MVKGRHTGDVIRVDDFHKALAVKGTEIYGMSQTELVQTLLEKEFPTLTEKMEKDYNERINHQDS